MLATISCLYASLGRACLQEFLKTIILVKLVEYYISNDDAVDRRQAT